MKATRLDGRCQGWRGQKYIRNMTSRKRRQLERMAIRNGDEDMIIPNIPAKGWAS